VIVVSGGEVSALIVKVRALEVPPPGAGLNTVTGAVPAAAMSVAGMAAVTCVAFTKVVVRAAPFHLTSEPETKLLPLTVSVQAGPPAVALLGTRVVSAGTGFVPPPEPTGVFMSFWISASVNARL